MSHKTNKCHSCVHSVIHLKNQDKNPLAMVCLYLSNVCFSNETCENFKYQKECNYVNNWNFSKQRNEIIEL